MEFKTLYQELVLSTEMIRGLLAGIGEKEVRVKPSTGDMFASWVAHDNLHIRQLTQMRRVYIERTTKPCKVGYAGEC